MKEFKSVIFKMLILQYIKQFKVYQRNWQIACNLLEEKKIMH